MFVLVLGSGVGLLCMRSTQTGCNTLVPNTVSRVRARPIVVFQLLANVTAKPSWFLFWLGCLLNRLVIAVKWMMCQIFYCEQCIILITVISIDP